MDTKIPYSPAAADRIADLEVALGQAKDAQETAETAQYRAEQRAQSETDRADGLETHLRRVLTEYVVDPVLYDRGIDPDRIDASDMEAITDSLIEALDRGAPVDDLGIDTRIADWEAR